MGSVSLHAVVISGSTHRNRAIYALFTWEKGGFREYLGPMAQRLEEHTLINAMLPQTHLVAVLEAEQALWLCRERG